MLRWKHPEQCHPFPSTGALLKNPAIVIESTRAIATNGMPIMMSRATGQIRQVGLDKECTSSTKVKVEMRGEARCGCHKDKSPETKTRGYGFTGFQCKIMARQYCSRWQIDSTLHTSLTSFHNRLTVTTLIGTTVRTASTTLF